MKYILVVLAISLGLVLSGCGRANQTTPIIPPAKNNPVEPVVFDDIKISEPMKNQAVVSPLKIKGEAKGTWFFEASFPIILLDNKGQEVVRGTAKALSDWMTEDFVPFEATLIFSQPTGSDGKLIFKKDNPSGLKENEKEVEINIKFK
jgi:hypothetical protein